MNYSYMCVIMTIDFLYRRIRFVSINGSAAGIPNGIFGFSALPTKIPDFYPRAELGDFFVPTNR